MFDRIKYNDKQKFNKILAKFDSLKIIINLINLILNLIFF